MKLAGQATIFLPYFFNPGEFYLSHDNQLLVEQFRSSIRFIAACWDQPGQPMITFLVRADMLSDNSREHVLALLSEIERGECNGMSKSTPEDWLSLPLPPPWSASTTVHNYKFDEQALTPLHMPALLPEQINTQKHDDDECTRFSGHA